MLNMQERLLLFWVVRRVQDFNEIRNGEINVACTNFTETLKFLRKKNT